MPRYMLRCNAYSYIRKIIHELNGPIHACFFYFSNKRIISIYIHMYTDSSASYSENDYLMGHFTIHFYYNYHYIIWPFDPNKQNKTFTDYFINWGVHSYRIEVQYTAAASNQSRYGRSRSILLMRCQWRVLVSEGRFEYAYSSISPVWNFTWLLNEAFIHGI